MLHEIKPAVLKNQYTDRRLPRSDDRLFIYATRQLLLLADQEVPTVKVAVANWQVDPEQFTYLFAIDEQAYFLLRQTIPGENYAGTQALRQLSPQSLAFASTIAIHLGNWYETNQYCGRCGHRMVPDKTERALNCANCGHVEFPKIAPAVIVGVTHGDRILLTKFLSNYGYDKFALISGYNEIGETLADTVRREVKEEVGLSVRHITYFDSQPWGFSGALLVGFFAELDQSADIQLEKDELSAAKWFKRADIPHDDTTASLSWTMIEAFRQGKMKH